MKNILRTVLLLVGLFIYLAGSVKSASAQTTQDFTVSNFQADYYLSREANQTADLHTVETITAEFPSYDQNHGILRAIPETYLGHTVSLKIDSVSNNQGQPVHFTTSQDNGNLVLKIGDANTYVHGSQVYNVIYDQKNVVSILSNDDEFYWNVNGDQWQQPFTHVTAKLHVPTNITNSFQNRETCYVGPSGSSDSSRCNISDNTEPAGLVRIFTADNLSAGENMTIVNGFNKDTFKLGPEIAQAQRQHNIKVAVAIAWVVGAPLLAAAYMFIRWNKYGRDPKGKGVIIPEYQPYKGLSVLTSSYIQLEKLNTKAISALIIELAVKGYLSIHETTTTKRLAKDVTSYSLKLEKAPTDLSAEQQAVANMFFGTSAAVGSQVDLSGLKNTLAIQVTSLKSTLGQGLTQAGFFRSNPETAPTKYYTVGILSAVAGSLVGHIFLKLVSSVGFLEFALLAGWLLAAAVIIIFGRYMPSRTDRGVEVRDHMLGLRDYIKLAEADRLNFLQSPAGAEKIQEAGLDPKDPSFKVKLFESLLPYAMVFNLEKNWAKQFNDIYKGAPNWYYGNFNTFSAVYLVSSLSNFSSYSAASFSPPHSSGSSGFGGGFSGGGGGGGGGGGW